MSGNEAELLALGCWAHSGAGPTTSFYLHTGDLGVLFDVGIDPISRFAVHQIDPTECTHVFLSHCHSDHSSGLSNFIFTRGVLGRELDSPPADLTVIGSASTLSAARQILALQYPDRQFQVTWVVVEPGDSYPLDETFSLAVIQTAHTVPCLAARVEGRNLTVGFTADSAPNPDFAPFFERVDILIGEAFGLEEDVGRRMNERGHMLADDLCELVTASAARRVLPFHFTEHYRDSDKRAQLLSACAPDGVTVHDPVTAPRVLLALDKP